KADGEESPYQYCGGDPVGKVDPSGEWALYALHRVSKDEARADRIFRMAVAGLVAAGTALVGELTAGIGAYVLIGVGVGQAMYEATRVNLGPLAEGDYLHYEVSNYAYYSRYLANSCHVQATHYFLHRVLVRRKHLGIWTNWREKALPRIYVNLTQNWKVPRCNVRFRVNYIRWV
ncbi:MAG: hypothetical protein QMC94_08605, partial [Anaerosomatales bacterium]|nr:hypothetical protein [Anaerosomatales bacterium]